MNTEDAVKWNEQGLVPAVAVHADTGAFLMLAWMNRAALAATLQTGKATFYSRSRGTQWVKGETSGNVLRVESVRLDCDGDTVVLEVVPSGPACHTGKPSCAYRVADGDDWVEDEGPKGAPATIVDRVFAVARARAESTAEKSYTKSLLDAGHPKIVAKLEEELGELVAELPAGTDERVVSESADLWFHWVVALAARQIPPARVWAELERRFGQSGHDEKRSRKTP